MMKKDFLKSKVTPAIALVLFILLYQSGQLQVIFSMVIILIASAIEYGKGTFKSLGFQRSRFKALDLLVIAPLLAAVLFAIYWFILIPAVTYLTGQPIDFSVFEPYKGNLPAILTMLAFVWISAAFGEEILYRGYLMRQLIKFFGTSKISIVLNIVLLAVIFGWMHSYQGITGQIITGIIGATLATIFHFRKYDMWFNIALHGFFDTIALALIYFSA